MQKESHAQALASYSPVMRALLTLALLTSILSYSPVALTQETITLRPQLTSEPFGTNTDSVSLPKLQAAKGEAQKKKHEESTRWELLNLNEHQEQSDKTTRTSKA